MKVDIKSRQLPRIVYLAILPLYVPLRFLFSCAWLIRTFWLKPDLATYNEFGIRVFAPELENKASDGYDSVFAALSLLKRYDKEKLRLIKKHVRILYLWSDETEGGCLYIGTGVFAFNFGLFHAGVSSASRACQIALGLVYAASKLELAGKFGAYLRISEQIKNRCEEEQRQTLERICE